MIFEFFLPDPEIAGLKITPMVSKIKAEETVEINMEYTSVFKKLSYHTIADLKEKFENDPKRNFELVKKGLEA
jgi:hypothetical protein